MNNHRGIARGPLRELARLYDVQTSYYDIIARRRRRASPEALRAVLRALGAPIESSQDVSAALRGRKLARWQGVEPVLVAWHGKGHLELPLPADQVKDRVACHLRLESGDSHRWTPRLSTLATRRSARVEGTRYLVKRLAFPQKLPCGYHRLTVEVRGRNLETLVISTPPQAYVPPAGQGQKIWGVFLPLYAIRSHKSWGSGDFGDLESLMDWVGEQAGGVVATLPFLASFLDEPFDPSPYAPVSRLFWNEFYLDLSAIPELAHCPAAQALLQSPATTEELAALHAASWVDYRRGMALKRRVLKELVACLLQRGDERLAAFRRFVAARPLLQDYARFRATGERDRAPWSTWPRRQREGHLEPGDYDPRDCDYHLYVQWLAHEQLQHFARKARQKGPGLYLDLPIGAHPEGYDTWRYRNVYAAHMSAGAPPDSFFAQGQKWGFPPLHPRNIRLQGYDYFVACLRHHLQYAGILRIDHVMGLHRLFWVPRGMEAIDGVYVRYHPEEAYAILALESRRHQALIVGEDLGTVPRYVRPTMAKHRVHRAYVAQYELRPSSRRALRAAPADSLACLNTHDMPTFASFWHGLDIQDRIRMGLLNEAGARRERRNRHRLQRALLGFLRRQGRLPPTASDPQAVGRACLAYLAAGRSGVVIANLEDLWAEPSPQNVPGTCLEHPNWSRKARHSLEEFRRMPGVLDTLKEINQQRSTE